MHKVIMFIYFDFLQKAIKKIKDLYGELSFKAVK